MRTGRPKAVLTMSNDERAHLLVIMRSRSLPAALTLRAKIVLACEREPSNAVVANQLGVGPHTIGKWRNRFIAKRIEGLYDEMRSGRPRTVEDEAVAELITKTRGRQLHLADGTAAFITIHPSFLLRIEDEADKTREYRHFVADLRQAAKVLAG